MAMHQWYICERLLPNPTNIKSRCRLSFVSASFTSCCAFLYPALCVLHGAAGVPLPLITMFSYAVHPTTTFTRFPQLPAELRLKIWLDVLPKPRTIHLVRDIDFTSISPSPGRRRSVDSHCVATFPCPRTISSLLHACRESRHEVLSRYQMLFTPKSADDRFFRIHYFDPHRDGLFVEKVWPWVRGGSSKPSALFEARNLSISCNAWWDMWIRESPQLFGKGGLLRFKHLEELHIVFRILTDHEREKIMQVRIVLILKCYPFLWELRSLGAV
jgi:hypothetical protein